MHYAKPKKKNKKEVAVNRPFSGELVFLASTPSWIMTGKSKKGKTRLD